MSLRSTLLAASLLTATIAFAGCGGAQATATDTGAAAAAAADLPAEATCPVSGKTFAPNASTAVVVHEGKTYYMCCPGCAKKFAADPSQFVGEKKTDASADASLPASAVCPVSGETFTPTAATETAAHDGKTYYMCCPGCREKFLANPESFLKKAEAAPAAAPATEG